MMKTRLMSQTTPTPTRRNSIVCPPCQKSRGFTEVSASEVGGVLMGPALGGNIEPIERSSIQAHGPSTAGPIRSNSPLPDVEPRGVLRASRRRAGESFTDEGSERYYVPGRMGSAGFEPAVFAV